MKYVCSCAIRNLTKISRLFFQYTRSHRHTRRFIYFRFSFLFFFFFLLYYVSFGFCLNFQFGIRNVSFILFELQMIQFINTWITFIGKRVKENESELEERRFPLYSQWPIFHHHFQISNNVKCCSTDQRTLSSGISCKWRERERLKKIKWERAKTKKERLKGNTIQFVSHSLPLVPLTFPLLHCLYS